MASLPSVRRVVLYKHGVASFERKITVTDNAEVELFFRHSEMNDVLKSLTVVDNNGGMVSSVSYDNSEPKEKRLKDLAITVTRNHEHLDVISQFSGYEVEMELFDETNPVQGTIIKTSQFHSNNELKHFICLKQNFQLLLIDFGRVKKLTILDDRINRELNEALLLCLTNVNKEEKKLSIFSQGSGSRELTIAYTVEAPIWKISYRVILPESEVLAENAECLLQGWAIIDNITDEKWDNISLTLIAGDPHSFEFDLFKPKYKKRSREEFESDQQPSMMRLGYPGQPISHPMLSLMNSSNVKMIQQAVQHPGQPIQQRVVASNNSITSPGTSTAVQTATKDIGDLFQYKISNPVTVNSKQSALVPIVHQKVSGNRVALFNTEKHQGHPNSAVFMVNNTDLTLESGPCTVLEGSTYVGESNFEMCKPNQSKFVEFATEQSMDIWTKSSSKSLPAYCRLSKGVLQVQQFHQSTTTYHIRSKSGKQVILYIEHRFDKSRKLVNTPAPTNPKPINYYIFRVTCPLMTRFYFPSRSKRRKVQRTPLRTR